MRLCLIQMVKLFLITGLKQFLRFVPDIQEKKNSGRRGLPLASLLKKPFVLEHPFGSEADDILWKVMVNQNHSKTVKRSPLKVL